MRIWGHEKGGSPEQAIRTLNLEQISDFQTLTPLVDEVLARYPALVKDFRAGKAAALNALIGRAMRSSQGKGDPGRIRELLLEKLNPDPPRGTA